MNILFDGKPLLITGIIPASTHDSSPPYFAYPCWKLIVDQESVIIITVKPLIDYAYIYESLAPENIGEDEHFNCLHLNGEIMEIFENAPPIEIMQSARCVDVNNPYNAWSVFDDEIFPGYVGVFRLPANMSRKKFSCGYLRGREFVVHIPIQRPFPDDVTEAKVFLLTQSNTGQKSEVTELQAKDKKLDAVLSGQKPTDLVKPVAKPIVTFSSDFLTVNCNVWQKSESRERARQAHAVLRKLYENYKRGNKPMSVEKIRKGISTERIDKLLDKNRYPQIFSLICQKTDERTGEREIWLSDNYEYRAE